VNAFRNYLKDHEEDFLFFKTNLLLKEAGDDPIRKSQVLKDIVKSIAKIPDMIKKSLYLKKCSDMMDISEEILVAETNKVIKADLKQKRNQFEKNYAKVDEDRFITAPRNEKGDQIQKLKHVVTGDDYQERDLLRVLISMGNQKLKNDTETTVAEFIIDNIEDEIDNIDNSLFRNLFQTAILQFKSAGRINVEAFTSSNDENVRNLVIDMLSSPYIYSGWEEKGVLLQTQKTPETNQENDALNSLRRFLYRKYDKKIKIIESKIKELDGQSEEEENLLLYMKAHKKALTFRSDLAEQLGSVFLK
jgi:DNA primase